MDVLMAGMPNSLRDAAAASTAATHLLVSAMQTLSTCLDRDQQEPFSWLRRLPRSIAVQMAQMLSLLTQRLALARASQPGSAVPANMDSGRSLCCLLAWHCCC